MRWRLSATASAWLGSSSIIRTFRLSPFPALFRGRSMAFILSRGGNLSKVCQAGKAGILRFFPAFGKVGGPGKPMLIRAKEDIVSRRRAMSSPQALLGKMAALRQRLAPVENQTRESSTAAAGNTPLQLLERKVTAGAREIS